jgi:hypothetical protein
MVFPVPGMGMIFRREDFAMKKQVSKLVCFLLLAVFLAGVFHPAGCEASVASVAVKAPGLVWRSLQSKVDDATRFIFRRAARHGDDAARGLGHYYDDLAQRLSPINKERLIRLKKAAPEDAIREALKKGDDGIESLYMKVMVKGGQKSGTIQYLLKKSKDALKGTARFVMRHPIISTLVAMASPYWREAVAVVKWVWKGLHFLVSSFGLVPGVFIFLLWGYLAWVGVKRAFLWVFGKLAGIFKKPDRGVGGALPGAAGPKEQ